MARPEPVIRSGPHPETPLLPAAPTPAAGCNPSRCRSHWAAPTRSSTGTSSRSVAACSSAVWSSACQWANCAACSSSTCCSSAASRSSISVRARWPGRPRPRSPRMCGHGPRPRRHGRFPQWPRSREHRAVRFRGRRGAVAVRRRPGRRRVARPPSARSCSVTIGRSRSGFGGAQRRGLAVLVGGLCRAGEFVADVAGA